MRRVPGFTYREDGSVFEPSMLSGLYGWYPASDFAGGFVGWPLRAGSGQAFAPSNGNVAATGTQNGHATVQFNVGATNDGYLDNADTPTIKEVFVVMKMREATFSNTGGIIGGTVAANNALLVGQSGSTKFTNLGFSGFSYWKNGTSYTQSDQQAPMNAWGIVRMQVTGGVAMPNGMRIGRDRDFAGRFAEADIADLLLFTSTLSVEDAGLLTSWLNSYWAVY